MRIEDDIKRIQQQEARLRFTRFDNATALALGIRLAALGESREATLTIEIRLVRETVFFYTMPGGTPANADWARRKRNTVELLHRSSYGVGRSLVLEGSSLAEKMGLPARDYAAHGGCFPIWVDAVGCVGTATVSGAPQRVDHELVVAALAELCGVPLCEVALD